jgi:hypothetical protein
MRALKRHKASQSLALSSLGTTEWGHIQSASGITLNPIDLPDMASSLPATPYTPFEWSGDPENKQSDRCAPVCCLNLLPWYSILVLWHGASRAVSHYPVAPTL